MIVTLTCPNCGSGVSLHPSAEAKMVQCDICQEKIPLTFTPEDEKGILCSCPFCQGQDFYQQKDFNRKIGVALFILAAIFSIWTYGLSFIALWLLDLFLFHRLGNVVICYGCSAIFRRVKNMADFPAFDHHTKERVKVAK